MTKEDTDDLTFWYYKNLISDQECSALIQYFSKFKAQQANIGVTNSETAVDTSIRNVNKIDLPVYNGVGALLTAVGIDANAQRWKFNIERSNQCEFLKYSKDGRYTGHLDTYLSNRPEHWTECRKLTVLAFLNDDFVGGKFFLKVGSADNIYPPQAKGTVLVFPSFLHHGVEDVIEGERYSIVCWMVGPWFK